MTDFDVTTELSQISIGESILKENVPTKPKKLDIQVEIRIKKKLPKSIIETRLEDIDFFLIQNIKSGGARNWKPLKFDEPSDDSAVETIFEKVLLGSCHLADGDSIENSELSSVSFNQFHVYKLNSDGPLSQNLGDDEDNIIGSQLWQLPCVEFENIWENLLYDSNLKNEVMSYVYALVNLSEKRVNPKIINVNRLILLVGPPGTGKTSLCKGLAQHLSIRFNDRYSRSVLVEINSHSLFSKWFSESGKLVQRMFDQIDDIAEDEKCMVFVLIDEIESLGMCRESSSAAEPADAIRAVNALLTQIDRVRRRPNVLIMCTSNLEKSLDRALVDRADLVKYVGNPSTLALYEMMKSCIMELIRIGIVDSEAPDPFIDVNSLSKTVNSISSSPSNHLLKISKKAHGLSGRAISMLPTLVVAKSLSDGPIVLTDCLSLLSDAVDERISRTNF